MRVIVVLLGLLLVAGCTGEASDSKTPNTSPEAYKDEVNQIIEELEVKLNEQLNFLESNDMMAPTLIESAAFLSRGDAQVLTPPEDYSDLHELLVEGLAELEKKAKKIYRHYEEGNNEYPEDLVDELIIEYQRASAVRYEIIKKYNNDNPIE